MSYISAEKGMTTAMLAAKYSLTEKRIQRIIRKEGNNNG